MNQIVACFLKNLALRENFAVYDTIFGAIVLGAEAPIQQSSGAVYGIWVQSEIAPTSSIVQIPGHEGWFPVYWGKDIAPVSRVKAHAQGHKNGNIDLPNVQVVQGKPLIYGAILVARYLEFETLLHSRYPPIIGTRATGRPNTIVQIMN